MAQYNRRPTGRQGPFPGWSFPLPAGGQAVAPAPPPAPGPYAPVTGGTPEQAFVAPRGRITMGQLMSQFGGSLPGEDAYYNAIMASQGKGFLEQLGNVMEARGLGQSSIIGREAGQGLSGIAQAILGQKFRSREQRIADALNFERQKTAQINASDLADQNRGGGIGGVIKDFASVAAQFLPMPKIGGGTVAPAGGSQPGQGANYGVGSRYQTAYDPYHRRPMGY